MARAPGKRQSAIYILYILIYYIPIYVILYPGEAPAPCTRVQQDVGGSRGETPALLARGNDVICIEI